jgi:transcriptional regulator with XRE-family HTH domain
VVIGMHAATRQEGRPCGVTRQAILAYEKGRIPYPETRRWLAAALHVPFDDVDAAARQQDKCRKERRILASAEALETSGEPACGTLEAVVRRRELLALFGRAAKAGLLVSTLPQLSSVLPTTSVGNEAIEAVMSASGSYRQLWPTTPTEALREPALAHLRLISRLLNTTTSETEHAALAAAASETSVLAAWLAEDIWDFDAVRRHYQEAGAYAEQAGDDLLQAHAAGCRSYWATTTGSGTEAVKLAQRATGLLPPTAPLAAQVWLAAREATAHATVHDEPAASNALIRAEKALERVDETTEPNPPWLSSMDDKELSRYRGYVGVSLELPDMAVPALTEALDSFGPAPTKWRALTLSKLAEARVQTGDVEEACDLGAEAFLIAKHLGDMWSLMAVRTVRVLLSPMENTQAVKAFDERMLSTLLALPR